MLSKRQTSLTASLRLCGHHLRLAIMVVRTLSRTLFFNPGRTIEFDVKLKLFERLCFSLKHIVTDTAPAI